MRELVIAIRNYNKDNYKDYIDNIKKAGFKNVFIEWYNKDIELQQSILNYVRKNDLNVPFVHLGYQNPSVFWIEGPEGDKEVERYINDLDICKSNNIDTVVMHTTDGYKFQPMCELGLNRLKRILEHAEKLNMKVAFENIELKGYLDYIINNIENPSLGICFDAGHCHLFFNNDFDTKKFVNKTILIHLHDNYKRMDNHNLPFDGTMNWEQTIKRIIELNYKGPIIMEVGPNDFYKSISIEEYYKLAYERGQKLIELFEIYENNSNKENQTEELMLKEQVLSEIKYSLNNIQRKNEELQSKLNKYLIENNEVFIKLLSNQYIINMIENEKENYILDYNFAITGNLNALKIYLINYLQESRNNKNLPIGRNIFNKSEWDISCTLNEILTYILNNKKLFFKEENKSLIDNIEYVKQQNTSELKKYNEICIINKKIYSLLINLVENLQEF